MSDYSPAPGSRAGRAWEGMIILGTIALIGVGLPMFFTPSAKEPAQAVPAAAAPPVKPAPQPEQESNPGLKLAPSQGAAKPTFTSPPLSLTVNSLGRTFAVRPVTLNASNELIPPDDVDLIGWWNRSARPGAPVGSGVYTAHSTRDGDPKLGLNQLQEIELDNLITVRTKDKIFTYRVSRVEKIAQRNIASRSKELFSQTARTEGKLMLITCDDWDGKVWQTNIFVFGDLVQARNAK